MILLYSAWVYQAKSITMVNNELIETLNRQLLAAMPPGLTENEVLDNLAEWINYLIQTDFPKLIFILYRTDVSENRLKELLLSNSHEEAAVIIAKLILERERQKAVSREQVRDTGICGEEKW